MMEITRDIILDLLPLYLADEVSADTRSLVESYLESDPELAEKVARSAEMELPDEIPVTLNKEDKMDAYKEAQQWLLLRTVVLAVIIAVVFTGLVVWAGAAFFVISH